MIQLCITRPEICLKVIILTEEFHRLSLFFLFATSNKMVIHPQKSKIMILGSQRKLEGTEEYLNVKIRGHR